MICLRAVGTDPVELTLEIDPEAKPGCTADCECTILTIVSFCYQTHQVCMSKRRITCFVDGVHKTKSLL